MIFKSESRYSLDLSSIMIKNMGLDSRVYDSRDSCKELRNSGLRIVVLKSRICIGVACYRQKQNGRHQTVSSPTLHGVPTPHLELESETRVESFSELDMF